MNCGIMARKESILIMKQTVHHPSPAAASRTLNVALAVGLLLLGSAYCGLAQSGVLSQGLTLWLDADNVNVGGNPSDDSPVLFWHDLSGLGNDASAPAANAAVYRAAVLNGHGGVDFSGSDSNYLATAYTSAFSFTNCTMLMVANHADQQVHVSISGLQISQEFLLYDKSTCHESAPYHWALKTHQVSPAGFFIQAGLFGASSNEMVNFINGVVSTEAVQYSWEIGQEFGVADYVPTDRQAILGWRNGSAISGPAISSENFNGVICEVLVYDRQLTIVELNQVSHYLEGKYGIPLSRPPLQLQLLSAGAGSMAFTWAASPGLTYQVQSCTNLSSAAWLDWGNSQSTTGSALWATNALGTERQRFYRVRLLP